MIGPVFLDPFRRTVIRDLGPEYEEGELTWGWPPHYRPVARVPVGADAPGVREAANTRVGAQFLLWSRFPCYRTDSSGDQILVRISDLRYAGGPRGGWARAEVRVPGR
jgi:hypothetical protein